MHAFNESISSTKAFVTNAKQVLPRAKSVRLQHNKHIRLLFEKWFRRHAPEKEWKLRKKSFSKTLFQLRMELKKGQKQGRDERT